tara:strand:+ start:603 stop:872 length:270 start_codon:yes stop_codon:yes gene_type:complete
MYFTYVIMANYKVIFIKKHGGPDLLELHPFQMLDPELGEVWVKISNIGIKFADLMGRMGLYPSAPKPLYIPGFEIVAVIDKVGKVLLKF